MPMDFLKRIEDATFPLAVHEQAEINCVSVLAAAELIEVTLLPASDACSATPVIVLRITSLSLIHI